MLGIKNFDVVLIQRKGFIGWAIRLFTRSEYDHTATVKEKGDGVLWLVEGKAFGKTKGWNYTKPLHVFLKECEEEKYKALFLRNNNPPKNRREIFKELEGTKYDYVSIGFYHVVKSLFGVWIGDENKKRVVCSHGEALINGVDNPAQATPQTLSEQGWSFVTQIGFEEFKPSYP